MKCPKCHAEVEKGSLYCPKCLQEIHWVSEYNTVETLMQKASRSQMLIRKKERLEKKQKKKIRMLILLGILGVCVCILWCMDHSYLVQYSLARHAYKEKDHERALEYADKALTISPEKGKAVILLSQVLEEQGDLEGAVKVMEGGLQEHLDSPAYHERLISLYEKTDQPEKIKRLIRDPASQAVRESFAHYLCDDPDIRPQTGVYDDQIKVSIAEQEGVQYHYTLDGSTPTRESPLYQGPFPIGEGTTEVYVLGVNAYGLTSDVIYRKYTVIPKEPEAPKIWPVSGTYDGDTQITVKVPDGFKAYYAFDEIPTESSTEYKAPVKMPVGEHTFYAVLIGVNDRVSEVASRYYCLYE